MCITPLLGGVDCLGLALDLEKQAARVESQSAERAMLAAARGLRQLEKLPPALTWISVHDRLPPDRREVLVWGYTHLIGGSFRRNRCLGMTRFNRSGAFGRFDIEDRSGIWVLVNVVTHWCEVAPPAAA